MVMGFCIGGPLIWNLLKRAPDRIVAAVLARPTDSARASQPLVRQQHQGLGPGLVKRGPDITMRWSTNF